MAGKNGRCSSALKTFETFVSALTWRLPAGIRAYANVNPANFPRVLLRAPPTPCTHVLARRDAEENTRKPSAVSLGKYGLARLYNPRKLPRSILHRVALPCRYVHLVLFDVLISTDAVSVWHFADKRSSPWEGLWIPAGRLCGFRVAGVDYSAWLGSLCIRGLKFSRVELEGSENWSFGKGKGIRHEEGISIC